MREQFLIPVGSDLVAASLPAGQIRSVMIDNPSGQWLQLFPTYEFIQPYTIGIVRTFPGEIQNVTIRRNAPAGQVGTQAGDPLRIILDSEPLPEAPGVPFITEFTPVLNAVSGLNIVVSTGLSVTLIAAVANRRIRLLSTNAVLGGFPSFGAPRAASAAMWSIAAGAATWMSGRVTPTKPVDPRIFQPGLDFPLSTAVNLAGSADFADVDFGFSATYQVV